MKLQRLKEWREASGFTQRGLSEASDVSQVTIARLETGGSSSPRTARKFAEALGVSVSDLMEAPPVPLAKAATSSSQARQVQDEVRRAPETEPGAPRERNALSPEWAHRAHPDLFHMTIKHTPSEELREFGKDLLIDFSRTRTREELREEGPAPDLQRIRAFSLAGIVNEELLGRDEEPLREYVLAFRRFDDAMSSGEEEVVREEEDQEYRAG